MPPQRLVDLVRATPDRGVCLLVSAPGYGRTALLREAVAAEGRCAWIAVDALDAAPGALARRLTLALGSVDADDATTEPSPDSVLRLLSTATEAGPTWLVVDDLEEAWTPDVLDLVGRVGRTLPAGARLAVSSRRGEHELLRRLRDVPVQMLTESELAWADDEVRAVLGPLLSDSTPIDNDSLMGLVAGWPAALGALQGHGVRGARAMDQWLRRDGAETLLGPWWSGLDATQRTFLRQTNVLDVLAAGLCDEVLRTTGSEAVLDGLVAEHDHLVPDDAAGEFAGWRRLPLLTAFLRRRPDVLDVERARHRAAAEWFAARGDDDKAIRHLVGAGRPEEAVTRVHAVEDDWFESGRGDAVVQWYALMPPSYREDTAELLLRQGWAQLTGGKPGEAELQLQRLTTLLRGEPTDDRARRLRAEAPLLAANLAASNADPTTMVEQATVAIRRFGDDRSGNAPHFARIVKARGLLWSGQARQAAILLDTAASQLPTSHLLAGLLRQLRAAVALAEGEIRVAHRTAADALGIAQRQQIDSHTSEGAGCQLVLGLAAFELGDRAGARDAVGAAESLARRLNHAGILVFALAGLARLAAGSGDFAAALASLAEGRDVLDRTTPRSTLRQMLALTEARFRLQMGDAVRAERLLQTSGAGVDTTLVGVRLAQLRRPGSGLGRLDRISTSDPRVHVERDVLRAEALAVSAPSKAEDVLLDVARVATSAGLLRSLADVTPRLRVLAADVAGRRGAQELELLLSVRDAQAAVPAPAEVEAPTPLSPGELQLLALLPGRDSNADLAARLSVSVNTVKTRLRRLYAKLGASGRDDAIRRARATGLLP